MNEFNCITNWLSSNQYASHIDKQNFQEWKQGKIDLSELKERFYKNNDFPSLASTIISDELFTKWLASIGWRK